MKRGDVLVAFAAGALCFGAGLWTGNGQDRWKISNHASCIANVQVTYIPLTTPARGVVHDGLMDDPRFLRRQQIQGVLQQIDRCNGLSGLATLDPLVEKRLYSTMDGL